MLHGGAMLLCDCPPVKTQQTASQTRDYIVALTCSLTPQESAPGPTPGIGLCRNVRQRTDFQTSAVPAPSPVQCWVAELLTLT